MTSVPDGPKWLRFDPEKMLRAVIAAGAKAILLLGPPRTGKTRAIDLHMPRSSADRETIQIHDGWGYDELMVSLRPRDGGWQWAQGPLLTAIRGGKKLIVLEEVNRTDFTQALGEVFSLLEPGYRGSANGIRLRNEELFFIPDDTTVIGTMNTLDRSTQDVDDAIFGRFSVVEFPPRVEALTGMLEAAQVPQETRRKLAELFSTINSIYPLGHGYFAEFNEGTEAIDYYLTRLRPVLRTHLQGLRDGELIAIDNKVDALFA